mgnify:CR=1 FL=1
MVFTGEFATKLLFLSKALKSSKDVSNQSFMYNGWMYATDNKRLHGIQIPEEFKKDTKIYLFVSLPMKGLTKQEIITQQQEALTKIQNVYEGYTIKLIKSFIDAEPPETISNYGTSRLWYLGKSFERLARADIVCFCGDWQKANGCLMEYLATKIYNPTARMYELKDHTLRFFDRLEDRSCLDKFN